MGEVVPSPHFMSLAIEYAKKAAVAGDYAVGALLSHHNEIVAVSGNRAKSDEDPTSHAEIVVIREAAKKHGKRHLDDHVLYTMHEPCPMCTSASVWAKLQGIVYGATIQDM